MLTIARSQGDVCVQIWMVPSCLDFFLSLQLDSVHPAKIATPSFNQFCGDVTDSLTCHATLARQCTFGRPAYHDFSTHNSFSLLILKGDRGSNRVGYLLKVV